MKIKQYEITYTALDDAVLPGQLGSMLRGVFGETLMQYDADLYEKFFEPVVSKENPAYKYVNDAPPAPFVIYPVKKYDFIRKNRPVTFVFTLMGEYRFYENNLIEVFKAMAKSGFNKGRLPVKLESIRGLTRNGKELIDFAGFPPPEEEIRTIEISFKTPFSVSYNRQLIADFDFSRLFGYIYRRIFILDNLYGSKTLPEQCTVDTGSLKILPVDINLKKQIVYRSPARGEKHPMTGWKGYLRYAGNLNPVMPYLQLGQLIHIGNYTVFGMGKYVLKYYHA